MHKFAISYFSSPVVITTFPYTGDIEVPLEHNISITFNKPVRRETAEAAFYIVQAKQGSFSWERNTMTFIPDTPFNRGDTIIFGLNPGVKGNNLTKTRKKFQYQYDVLSNLSVALAAPTGNISEPVENIVVMFDRAVVIPEEGTPIIKVFPEISGEEKWIGSSAYMIKPEELSVGTEYFVEVVTDLASVDGGFLEKGYSFSFVNYSPAVLHQSVDNQGGTQSNPYGPVTFYFNQKVDKDSVFEKIKFVNLKTNESVPFSVEFVDRTIKDNKSYYYNVWEKNWQQKALISPINTLDVSTQYSVSIEAGFVGAVGTAQAESSSMLIFTSAKLPGYLGASIQQDERNVEKDRTLTFHFQSPMDREELEKKMVVTPSSSEEDRSYYIGMTNGNSDVSYRSVLKRSTNYEFFIPANTLDAFGRPLGEDVTLSFRTAPFSPTISLQPSGTYFSTFSSNLDTRFITRVVNVSELDYDIYKLTKDQFITLSRIQYSSWENISNDFLSNTNIEHVLRYRMNLDTELNVYTDTLFNLNQDAGSDLSPGFYFLVASVPDSNIHDNMAFTVGDVAVTTKDSVKNILVWASSLSENTVKDGYNVEVYSYTGRSPVTLLNDVHESTPFITGVTNSDGVYLQSGNHTNKSYLAIVEKDGDVGVSFSDWDDGIRRYDFTDAGYSYTRGSSKYKAFIQTDKTLYRPGDIVNYSAYIRNNNLHTFTMPPSDLVVKLSIKNIYDYSGTPIYEERFSDLSLGYIEGHFKIPESVGLGTYSINLDIDTGKGNASTRISIQEYVVPEFEVLQSVPESHVVRNDTVNLKTTAAYFSGSPLVNASIDYRLYKRNYIYRWNEDPSYNFYSSMKYYEDSDRWRGFEETVVSESSGYTDSIGELSASRVVNTDSGLSAIYTFESDVLAPSGRKLTGSDEFVVHMAEHYTGIKSENYFVEADEETSFDVVTVSTAGIPDPGIDVKYSVYKREYFRVKTKDSSGNTYYETSFEDTLVDTGGINTGSDGKESFYWIPSEGGFYIIVVESYDKQGNISTSDTYKYVSSPGRSAYWKRENHDRVELITDKEEYNIGDVANILAVSTLEKTVGFLTVEAEGILDYKVFYQQSSGDTFDISIKDTYVPNVYLSALMVTPGDSVYAPPEFRMGVKGITVDTSSKNLDLEIKTDKSEYSPKESGTGKIIVHDSEGNPVKNAKVTVALVDDAIMLMSPIKRADVFTSFYSKRPWSVDTNHSLTKSLDRINANTEIGAKGGSGSKGGAGGDYADLSREDFSETAYWSASVTTNENGEANISFTLPDSTTRWNLFALARNSQGDKFGQNYETFGSTLKYFVSPALPRFLRVGDTFDLGAVIHNTSQKEVNSQINVEVENITLNNKSLENVTVRYGYPEKVSFLATAGSEGIARIKIYLTVDNQPVDLVVKEIPILPFGFEDYFTVSNTLNYSAEEIIKVNDSANLDHGELLVNVYGSNLGVAEKSIENLKKRNLMNTCTDTYASLLISHVYKYRYYEEVLGITDDVTKTRIDQFIDSLRSYRRSNGGWGYCQNSPNVNVDSTVYALEALREAELSGFSVDLEEVNKTIKYIQDSINGQTPARDKLAYYVYVLELSGVSQLGRIEELYRHRASLSDYGKANLILAMDHSEHSWKKQISQLLSELVEHSDLASQRVFWNYSPDVWWCANDAYVTATVLRAFNVNQPNGQIAGMGINYLARNSFIYLSTRTHAGVSVSIFENGIRSGIKGRDTNVNLYVNDALKGSGELKKKDILGDFSQEIPVNELLLGDNRVKIDLDKGGNSYYSMILRTLESYDKIDAFSNDFALTREYLDMDGNYISDNFKLGETYAVRLTIASPNLRRHVALEDYLPAGFESVNGSLENESSLSTQQAQNAARSEGLEKSLYVSNIQMKDSKTEMYIRYLGSGVYEYTYLVRAVVPGEYKLRPAQLFEINSPDVRAYTSGDVITIVE